MKKRILPGLVCAFSILTSTIQAADWVTWPVSQGGNGHSYLPVRTPNSISWRDADQLAREAGGYLATITSAAENAFVFGLVDSPEYLGPGSGPLLGGYQIPGSQEPAGGWTWVTGESWGYSNWLGGQPDNGGEPEDAIHFLPGGQWNDKSSVGLYFHSYVVERGGVQGTEWPAIAGGNGHSYLPVKVSSPITWDQASRDARQRGGYLATLTTMAENDFVFGLIDHPLYWDRGEFGPLLGGYQPPGSSEPSGGWTWVTGETWSFANWAAGQPDNAGGEDGIHFWNGNKWNDAPTNLMSYLSYVVEFDNSLCTPRKARATAQLVNGFVVGATVTDTGCGYTNAPVVLIKGGGGTGATATAIISNGVVTGIQIVSAGCCYTNAPRIVIASPPFVPSLGIEVSRVRVIQNVVLGRRYVLEASTNGNSWSIAVPAFTAEDESITNEFDTGLTGRFFRIRETP